MNISSCITVVCYANYCRSPVAEHILKKKYKKKFLVKSAGISPITRSGMDIRSINWLEENNYSYSLHEPKKITSSMVKNSKLVFCLDTLVLIQMNKMFPSYKNKFKCLNFQMPKIKLDDPYHYSPEDYNYVMEKIENVCLNLSIT